MTTCGFCWLQWNFMSFWIQYLVCLPCGSMEPCLFRLIFVWRPQKIYFQVGAWENITETLYSKVTTVWKVKYGDYMTDGSECRKINVVWTPNKLYKFSLQRKCWVQAITPIPPSVKHGYNSFLYHSSGICNKRVNLVLAAFFHNATGTIYRK